nr:hypothetical protein Itr_chr09CG10150 [Ipomoea trifida]
MNLHLRFDLRATTVEYVELSNRVSIGKLVVRYPGRREIAFFRTYVVPEIIAHDSHRLYTEKSEAGTTAARSVPITEWIPYVLQASAVVQATAIPQLGISSSTATASGNSEEHKNKGNIEVKLVHRIFPAKRVNTFWHLWLISSVLNWDLRYTGKSEAATTVARSFPITEWIPYVLQASAAVEATAIPELGISTSTATAWGNSQAHKNKGNIEVKR